jgi:hypothetical protein
MSALPPKADINRYDFGFLFLFLFRFRFVLKSQPASASFAASSALARVAAAPAHVGAQDQLVPVARKAWPMPLVFLELTNAAS